MSDEFDDLVKKARAREAEKQLQRKIERENQKLQELEYEKRRPAEENLHATRAKKFIAEMRSLGIAPLPVYVDGGTVRRRKWSLFGSREWTETLPPKKVGEGWLIQRDYQLVLMTDGQVLEGTGGPGPFDLHLVKQLPKPCLIATTNYSKRILGTKGWDVKLANLIVDYDQGRQIP